jgi:nitrite reductase (NADH) large subunit
VPDPRYLVLRVRRPGPWAVARAAVLAGLGGLVAALLLRPATGLLVLWGVVVPLLPLVWLVAPGLWRNVCPMATANQLPRWLGLSSAKRLPPWLVRHGYGIAAGLFLLAVALRPGLLQVSATASAALLLLAPLAALTAGARFAGKSGAPRRTCCRGRRPRGWPTRTARRASGAPRAARTPSRPPRTPSRSTRGTRGGARSPGRCPR